MLLWLTERTSLPDWVVSVPPMDGLSQEDTHHSMRHICSIPYSFLVVSFKGRFGWQEAKNMLCSSLRYLIIITKIIIGKFKKNRELWRDEHNHSIQTKEKSSERQIHSGPFLSSFSCRSCHIFSGFLPGCFLVCQLVFWFPSRLFSGLSGVFPVSCQIVSWFLAAGFLLLSCLGTVAICYSIGVFLRVHKRHSQRWLRTRTLPDQWKKVQHTEAPPDRMEALLWNSTMKRLYNHSSGQLIRLGRHSTWEEPKSMSWSGKRTSRFKNLGVPSESLQSNFSAG